MIRALALAAIVALVACGGSIDPTGTDDCAAASASACPEQCFAVRGARLDRDAQCREQALAMCSRVQPPGAHWPSRCCARIADGALFALSGMECPSAPRYSGWRGCTREEDDALTVANACD